MDNDNFVQQGETYEDDLSLFHWYYQQAPLYKQIVEAISVGGWKSIEILKSLVPSVGPDTWPQAIDLVRCINAVIVYWITYAGYGDHSLECAGIIQSFLDKCPYSLPAICTDALSALLQVEWWVDDSSTFTGVIDLLIKNGARPFMMVYHDEQDREMPCIVMLLRNISIPLSEESLSRMLEGCIGHLSTLKETTGFDLLKIVEHLPIAKPLVERAFLSEQVLAMITATSLSRLEEPVSWKHWNSHLADKGLPPAGQKYVRLPSHALKLIVEEMLK